MTRLAKRKPSKCKDCGKLMGLLRDGRCDDCIKIAYTIPKPSKMRNIWTIVDGIKFQSKKEANRYQELKLLEKAGEIIHLEWQVKYPLNAETLWSITCAEICSYKLDFQYLDTKKHEWHYEDVKGRKAGPAYQLFKLKKKWMKAQYGIEITEV